MAVLSDGEGQLTLEIAFKTPLIPIRLWTGEGNLRFETNTYLPGKLMDIGETQIALSVPESLPSFAMALTQDGDRLRFFNNDPGPLTTTINYIWRLDHRNPWASAFVVEGRLSEAVVTLADSLLTVTIEALLYDSNHGETEGWNHAAQLRRDATDRGMEYINKLDQSVRWPP